MARIKPDEIKEGDALESSTINSTQDSIRTLEISRANIRQEGITADVIKANTVFAAPTSTDLRRSAINRVLRSSPDYETEGIVRNHTGDAQYITLNNVLGDKSEKVIVRASCRINMDDYGARTFGDMVCPTITMSLRHSTDANEEDLEQYLECDGTLQNFELAWSGKIPSSAVAYTDTHPDGSTLGLEMVSDNKAFNSAYVGSGGAHDEGFHEFIPHENSTGLSFPYDFTYQTSWLYTPPNSVVDQVHFSLFGYAEVRQPLAPPGTGFLGMGGSAGCFVVTYPGFKVRYMHLSAVRVKR